MKRIYLIRHGETESNRVGIFRGRLDIALSPQGLKQAQELKSYFETIPLDIIYTSPMKRAIKTAEIAFPQLTPIIEPSLNNLDLGEWSGKNKALVKKKYPQQWENWVKRPETITFPDGECLGDVMVRSKEFLNKIRSVNANTIAAVSHRSVVKVILAAALGIKKNYYWKFHLDNASISHLYFELPRGFTLVKMNDTHHLNETIMEWF